MRPKLGIIAGPNGSGKSTFYDLQLQDSYPLFINADRIAQELVTTPEGRRNLEAAEMAEEQRTLLLSNATTFAFETVFSRTEHWRKFIEKATLLNYRIDLYFLCTESPILNVARVGVRVDSGGHSVPAEKVFQRYYRSIETALRVQRLVDQLWLYDNSKPDKLPRLLGRFVRGKADYIAGDISVWALPFFKIG